MLMLVLQVLHIMKTVKEHSCCQNRIFSSHDGERQKPWSQLPDPAQAETDSAHVTPLTVIVWHLKTRLR